MSSTAGTEILALAMRAREGSTRFLAVTLGMVAVCNGAIGYCDERPSTGQPLDVIPRGHMRLSGADTGVAGSLTRAPETPRSIAFRGFTQTEISRTFGEPDHWSRLRVRNELSATGRISDKVRWKLSGRLDYDAVFDVTSFYPPQVRKDERFNFFARENYIDFAAGDWDFRLGRQHIVWGEIVGLFFADVVSAKDYRDFLLPEFDILRVPQWAAHAAYTGRHFHTELVWIPFPSYDKIPKPGAEFFALPVPSPPGVVTQVAGETRPGGTLGSTYGLRISTLQAGWDVAAFYYRSIDASPTFYRTFMPTPQPTVLYQPRHEPMHQFGSTLSKELRGLVFRAEITYTSGRQFNVTRLAEPDGVVPQDTFDWVGSVDLPALRDTRVNGQLFQRVFLDHDADLIPKRRETGYSLYVTHDFPNRTQAQLLFISSVDRPDWMLHPRVLWNLEKNWRVVSGIALFRGPPAGFFGRFASRDRVYAEVRYSF